MNSSSSHCALRVWDLPTRLFHWLFAACVIGALVTIKLGDGLWMEWHMRFGIFTLALLVFRLIWGFTGSYYARFGTFIKGPSALLAYLRHRTAPVAGHNPLGGLSVIAMLVVIAIQAVSGLFVSDDILYEGPFYAEVSQQTAQFMRSVHATNENFVIALIALHLLAILIYTLTGKGLVRAMITGNANASRYASDSPMARDDLGLRLWGLILAFCCGAGAWWLIDLAESAGMSF